MLFNARQIAFNAVKILYKTRLINLIANEVNFNNCRVFILQTKENLTHLGFCIYAKKVFLKGQDNVYCIVTLYIKILFLQQELKSIISGMCEYCKTYP